MIPERRHWRITGVVIVNFEHISHLVVVFSFRRKTGNFLQIFNRLNTDIFLKPIIKVGELLSQSKPFSAVFNTFDARISFLYPYFLTFSGDIDMGH